MKIILSFSLKIVVISLFLSFNTYLLSALDFQKEVSFSNTTTGTSVIKVKVKISSLMGELAVALHYYWEPAKGYEGLNLPTDNAVIVEFVIDSTRYYIAESSGASLEAYKWSETNSNVREKNNVFFKKLGTGLSFSGYLSEDNNKYIYDQLERGNYVISRAFFVTNQDSLYTQKIKRNKKIEEEKRLAEEKGPDDKLKIVQEDLEKEERLIKEKLLKEKREEEKLPAEKKQEDRKKVSLNDTEDKQNNTDTNNSVLVEKNDVESNTTTKNPSLKKYDGNKTLTLEYVLTEEMITLYSKRLTERNQKKTEEEIKKNEYIENVKKEVIENKYKPQK